MKRTIAMLLATLSVAMLISVPVNASDAPASKPPVKPLTHGVGGS